MAGRNNAQGEGISTELVNGLVQEINSHESKEVSIFDYEKSIAELKGEAALSEHEKHMINMACPALRCDP